MYVTRCFLTISLEILGKLLLPGKQTLVVTCAALVDAAKKSSRVRTNLWTTLLYTYDWSAAFFLRDLTWHYILLMHLMNANTSWWWINVHICQSVLLLMLNGTSNSPHPIFKKAIRAPFWSQPARDKKRQSREGSTHNMKKTPTKNYQHQSHVLQTGTGLFQDGNQERYTEHV